MKDAERVKFILEFSAMMEGFGDSYMRQHGEEINGRHLICALVRWLAATIASAPPPERAQLVLQAIRQLHGDLDAAENRKPGRLN